MTNTTAIQFPALSGDPVTEAHARTCRERGHATHTVDGVDTGRCPRCGELVEAPISDSDRETFDRILDKEGEVRSNLVSVQFAPLSLPEYLKAARFENYRTAKAALYAAMDALSPEQAARFGAYRKQALGA